MLKLTFREPLGQYLGLLRGNEVQSAKKENEQEKRKSSTTELNLTSNDGDHYGAMKMRISVYFFIVIESVLYQRQTNRS